jgi:hypothetical protein
VVVDAEGLMMRTGQEDVQQAERFASQNPRTDLQGKQGQPGANFPSRDAGGAQAVKRALTEVRIVKRLPAKAE